MTHADAEHHEVMLSPVAGATHLLDLPREVGSWYPLAPLQAGMLYDALRLGRNSGHDVEQVHLVLQERTDPAMLARAFQWITQQHTALHTEFGWDRGGSPQQRVSTNTALPTEIENFTHIEKSEQARLVANFLDADRQLGFDMRHAPLGRLRIFVMDIERTEVIWTLHHIVVDAVSLPIALIQVFETYERLCRGTEPSINVEFPPYRSYVQSLANYDIEGSRAYFSGLLTNVSAPPTLPGSKAILNCGSPKPTTFRRSTGSQLLDLSRAVAARTGTTVETVIHAAWALVLSRHCECNDDIVFGVTRACRLPSIGSNVENMVGLLANTLPVRARCADEMTVEQFLQSLRAQSLSLRVHEHMPLYEIEHQGARASSALFNTTLTYQRWELESELRKRGGPSWQNRTCALYEQPVPTLNARVIENEQLEVTLLYDATTLDSGAVERMSESFVHTLGALAENELRQLEEISVLPPSTTQYLIRESNETSYPIPENRLIHELFESWTDIQPDALAVESSDCRLTYRELEEAANRVAHELRACGVKSSDFVGICMNRGAGLVIALLGVAKSGASYVPLDPQYPTSRLSFMIQDSAIHCVLTEPAHAHLFDGCVQLSVSQIMGRDDLPTTRPARSANEQGICYAIYTSGTTGIPNGVLMSHRAVANTLDWVNRTFQVGPGDRALFVTSPCFDLSVYDVFGVLGAGATTVVTNDQQVHDPIAIGELVDNANITIWNSAPAVLGAVFAAHEAYPQSARLRLVMLSGDWIPLTLPDKIRERYRKARVVSLGGATEAAIWSNWFSIERVNSEWASIPYGVPIQNCRYYVLDRKLRPAPIGVPGDLYIGGVCLADGYLNRPELTRERFIQDPFAANPSERMYKTGDRAIFHEDGQIRLLGRQDSQVKIRGVRVELGEVEAALSKIPGIKESVAVSFADGNGQKAIGAYVVLDNGSELDSQAIRKLLGECLTTFAVPSRVAVLQELPLSANGKIDRKSLPPFDENLNERAYVPPRSSLERKLVEIWEDLLRVRPIGLRDDFFALGGHSLLAVALVSRMRAEFGWDVPLEGLIAKPTIDALISANAEEPTNSEPKHFLVFNAKGTKPPIVFVPGVYGTLFVFRQFPKYFGPDQPVYLAKDYTEARANTPDEPSIENMAEVCELELVELCKKGSIVLAGLSCGILIAFELAHRLSLRGVEVPLLVSLDGMAPGYPEFLPRTKRLWAHIRAFALGNRTQYLKDRMANTRRRFLRLVGREHELHAEVQCASPELRKALKRTFYVNYRASKRYYPRFRYSGKLLLFRAERPERWVGIKGLDALNGWGQFVEGKISVVTLPGDHSQILNAANQSSVVQSIAEHMKKL